MKPESWTHTSTHVIRMFPDYADTVLWFDGPIHYCDSALSTPLVARLRDWERSFYDSLDRDHEFRSRARPRDFTLEGKALAGLVAAELGPGFAIEFRGQDSVAQPDMFRSEHSALNPAAATCLARIAQSALAAHCELEAAARSGPLLAQAPLSGTVSKPVARGSKKFRRKDK